MLGSESDNILSKSTFPLMISISIRLWGDTSVNCDFTQVNRRFNIILFSIYRKTGNIMSEGRKSLENNDSRKEPISSIKLWEALTAALDVFGPSMKEATLSELQKTGLDLEHSEENHTIADIGEKLSSIFGPDGTEVILEQIAKRLGLQD